MLKLEIGTDQQTMSEQNQVKLCMHNMIAEVESRQHCLTSAKETQPLTTRTGQLQTN